MLLVQFVGDYCSFPGAVVNITDAQFVNASAKYKSGDKQALVVMLVSDDLTVVSVGVEVLFFIDI